MSCVCSQACLVWGSNRGPHFSLQRFGHPPPGVSPRPPPGHLSCSGDLAPPAGMVHAVPHSRPPYEARRPESGSVHRRLRGRAANGAPVRSGPLPAWLWLLSSWVASGDTGPVACKPQNLYSLAFMGSSWPLALNRHSSSCVWHTVKLGKFC